MIRLRIGAPSGRSSSFCGQKATPAEINAELIAALDAYALAAGFDMEDAAIKVGELLHRMAVAEKLKQQFDFRRS